MPNPTPELPEDLRRIFEKLNSIRDHAAELERRLKIATDALERITRMSETHGRPDCKWGDTDFNSAAVAYGQNLLLEDVKHMAYKALALFPVDKKDSQERK